ncbi:MAG: putative HTH-type transcriptional regulator [Chthonomonadaceae bacterium]|nr:putative HTH-type transcriptional regulator [Chthonomonadaceae bacterium]
MNQKKQTRCRPERGVVLTEEGLGRLEAAIKAWWDQEPLEQRVRHRKLAQEAIAEKLDINIKTVRRIRSHQAVDRATLRAAFETMNLIWHDAYSMHTALWQSVQTLQSSPANTVTGYSPSLIRTSTSGEASSSWPNLPLLGREAELELVVQTLGVSRLVTLTGSGGVGKSRLAQAVEAVWAAQSHPYLTCWVDLTSDICIPWATTRVQNKEQDTISYDMHAHSLWNCSLLVLDNGDQAKSPYTHTLLDLLRACPNLRVLVTSRKALGLPGEVPVPILPLRVASPLDVQNCSERVALLSGVASAQLFLQVLQTLQPSFEITEENAEMVASICYSLDGIPRSLEFAAAVMAHHYTAVHKQCSTLLVHEAGQMSISTFDAP